MCFSLESIYRFAAIKWIYFIASMKLIKVKICNISLNYLILLLVLLLTFVCRLSFQIWMVVTAAHGQNTDHGRKGQGLESVQVHDRGDQGHEKDLARGIVVK